MPYRTTYRAQAGALLALGLPLAGSHLAQMALHVTDTVIIGWYGVTHLAALVLGGAYFFIFFILGAGFAGAVMPMVATALGRGDEAQVRRDTRMGMWLSILFGLAVSPVLWWSQPILESLGQKPEVAALAAEFLRIAGFGIIPALLVMVLKSYLSATGRTGIILWGTLATFLLNIVLNWALVFGNWGAPELGISGSAIATLTAQIVSLAILALYAAWHPALRRYHLFSRFWRADWPVFAQVFRLGWPIGLTSVAEGGLFNASALMMGWIGTVQLAAHGIALNVAAVAFMVHLGLSNAATILVGRANGEGDARGMADGARVAVTISAGFAVVIIILMLIMPRAILGLFLDKADPHAAEILAFGTRLLAVAALFQLFDALQVMGLGFLRGVQDPRAPMWIAIFSYWVVGAPAGYILAFPMAMGGVGLWLGLTFGLSVAAVLLLARFWIGWIAPGRTAARLGA